MSKHSEYDGEKLTEAEINLLQTPLRELRQAGLFPSAIAALDKKHALNRLENERAKQSN